MNLNKINRTSKGAIATYFIRLVMGVVFLALFIAIYVKATVITEEIWHDFDPVLIAVASVILLLYLIATIIHLVFYIITIIDAYSFKEDQLPFALIIIGLFIRVIGIVGIFLLRNRLKQILNDDKELSSRDD